MGNLKIKLIKKTNLNPIILLDNREIFFQKQESKNLYETNIDKEEVDITIFSVNEFEHRLWFLFAFLFYFISIFGIFNSRYNKSSLKLKYSGKIKIQNYTDVTIELSTFNRKSNPVSITSNSEIIENENTCYIDSKVKKRFKYFTLFKIIFWIIAIVLAIYFLLITIL